MKTNELLLAISELLDSKFDEKLSPVYSEIKEIQSNLTKLDTRLSSLEAKVSSLEARLSSLETKVSDMDSRLSSLETKVSDMDSRLSSLEAKVSDMDSRLLSLNLTIENMVLPDLRLLAENYVPAAKRYEAASNEIDSIKLDVECLKEVVAEHSRRFQQIS